MEREKVNNFFVYGLVDPRDNQIKYIGKTTNLLKKRFYHHISESLKSKKPNKKQAWIINLIKQNIRPLIVLLDSCNSEVELNESEIFFISYYRFLGQNLKNSQPGGEGNPKGYKFKNRFVAPKGVKVKAFEEYRKSGKNKGIIKSEETRKKLSNSLKGKKRPNRYKKIYIFNSFTKEIHIKNGTQDAAKFLNTTKSIISHYLNNTNKYLFKNKWMISRNKNFNINKKSKVIAENEKICYIFNSKIEASKFFNVSRDTIYYNINKKLKGYNIWVKA
jgi:hypothetical protein